MVMNRPTESCNEPCVSTTEPRCSYLLIFSGDSARLRHLPLTGDLMVSRTADGTLKLHPDDGPGQDAVAILQVREGNIRARELAPGALKVNGQPAVTPRQLVAGDVLSLGDDRLVFYRDPRRNVGADLLDPAQLERRLGHEVERASRYDHPLAVLCVHLPDGRRGWDQQALNRAVTGAVRCVDLVSWDGGREYLLVLPETGDLAEVPAGRVMDAVSRLAPGARPGLAIFPDDGSDGDALITGARAAAAADGGRLSGSEELVELPGHTVVCVDPKMRHLFRLCRKLAFGDIPVLITGETGVGKEIFASALHAWSSRCAGPMITLNCAAIPDTLLESELFGHERGAFSGAVEAKAGLLEAASGGTLFLDEVGECSPRAQAGLLRVLETGLVRRLGSVREVEVDVRLVAATNRSLDQEMEAGNFRQDLYYRLGAASLQVPPLRERPLDLAPLARRFLAEATADGAGSARVLTPGTLQRLQAHDWPGNVRELRNLMAYLATVVRGEAIRGRHLPEHLGSDATPWLASGDPTAGAGQVGSGRAFQPIADEIRALERRRMSQALAAAGGARKDAAALIGMPLRTFVSKLKAHGLVTFPRGSRPRSVGLG